MEKEMGVAVIAGACLLVLFMVLVKRKAELFLNFCLRAVMGAISIYGVNLLCSLLTSGTLGFSGVTLLYAIAAFRFL